MKKKKALTLLEIMIVIFLIGIIGSVIGYNMKGSLDKGRVFKTERAIEQLTDILSLELAKGTSVDRIQQKTKDVLKESGLVKNPEKLLQDGWGNEFKITVEEGEIKVVSANLNKAQEKT